MSVAGSADQARHGALALLADGNSAESVAHVFGVSLDQVARWQEDAGAAAIDAPLPMAAPSQAMARQPSVRLAFASEVVQATPLLVRLPPVGFGGVMLAMAFLMRGSFPASGVGSAGLYGVALLLAIVGVCMILTVRVRFVLGTHAIVAQGAILAERMAYEDVWSVDVIQDVKTGGKGQKFLGRRVTIRSRHLGVEPLSVFLYDAYPVNPAFAERLAQLPGLNSTAAAVLATTPPRPKRPMSRAVAAALMLFMVIGMAKYYMPLPLGTIATVRRGQPELSQLERVDGDLLGLSACTRATSKSPWYRDASIRTDAGVVQRTLPCDALGHPFADGRRHRLTIYDDPNASAKSVVYQAEIDGKPLLFRDAVAAQRASTAQFLLMAELVMLLGLGTIFFMLGRIVFGGHWDDLGD